jgi:RNA polymerase sigma factor (sigma-70 family)
LENLFAIQQGDHAAFMRCYAEWDERVYYYFLKKTGLAETAKELTQITFIKIWQHRSSLSPDYSFEVQLFQRARLAWIDDLRKRASERKRQQSFQDFSDGQPQSKDEPAEFEMNHHLKTALDHLPPMRKKVFELHRLQGYSYREIATHLSISVKTVDNHLSKAVRQLKSLLTIFILLLLRRF